MPENKKRITINDIATHAGVSRSTVSLVLRGNARISEATRDRVNASMQLLGYTYNRNAANLRTQSSQAIGLIINDLTNPFFAELTAAIEEQTEKEDYFVYLVQSGEDPDHQHDLATSLIEHGVAGLIICPATNSHPKTFDLLHGQNMPTCIAVRPWQDERFDFCGPDNFRAAQLATAEFLRLGHRRIAFLGGQPGNPSRADRVSGYFSVLQKAGIDYDSSIVIESRPSWTSGAADVEKVLSSEQRPTAALCYNDFVAISVMHGLRQHNLEPGRDMALIGFDGMPEAEMAYPPLTTVSMHPRDVGRSAAELLIKRIQQPNAPVTRHVQEPQLIIRKSSG